MRCHIVFQGHPSKFKVTRLSKSSILIRIERLLTLTKVWNYRWHWHDSQSLMYHKLLIHSHFQTPTAAPFRKYAFIYPCSHLSQNMLVKGAPWYQWWHNSIDRECQYHNPVTDDIRYHDMETLYASLVVWIGNPPAISGSNDKSIWWLVFHVFSQSILIQFTVIWQHSNCRLSDTQVRSCDVTVMKQIHK